MNDIQPQIRPAGDSCMVVDFGNHIALDLNARVQALRSHLESHETTGVIELMPTYRSLAVYFDPVETDLEKLRRTISNGIDSMNGQAEIGTREAVIPVCYGGEYGPDLESVAEYHEISTDELIRRHSARSCYCYMLGFTPGFSYLGGMDESIATPRLDTPRELIPAGSVGIAGKQTGIYPIDSPGGWRLIGRTPLIMYEPDRKPATLIDAGLWIRFRPINRDEFMSIREKAVKNEYALEIVEKGDEQL